ncbi:hypothetical protein NHX12_020210, partial [Muraenolepis orangiensis]
MTSTGGSDQVKDSSGRWTNPWTTWRFPSPAMQARFLLWDKDNSNVPTSKEGGGDGGGSKQGLRVTWLGHATALVELDGLSILTDPMFSQWASPVQSVGYKRYRGPPCTVEQLPRIDAVVISHSHYDHLDANTVKDLNARYGAELHWFVPLGLSNWLRRSGCESVRELDWWEETCVPGHEDVTLVCTPAQHWSNRTALDKNK